MTLRAAALSGSLVDRLGGTVLSSVQGRLRASGRSCREVGEAFLRRLAMGPESQLSLALAGVCQDADASGVGNPYHNPSHSREVAVDWFCLALLHNALVDFDPAGVRLDPEQMVIGLCAAFGHDVGHDGRGNRDLDGRYRAFRLEQVAADRVARRLAGAGASAAQADLARCAILITDPRAGYPVLERALRGEGRSEDVRPEFGALEEPAARLICAMLRDADLMPSAGMTAGDHDARTKEMLREQGRGPAADPQADAATFLAGLVGGRFLSPAGARFQPDLDRLLLANAARPSGAQGLASAAPTDDPDGEDVDRLVEELGLESMV